MIILISCEYAHTMSSGLRTKGILGCRPHIGGCKDLFGSGLTMVLPRNEDGVKYYGYGGDLELPNDGNFVVDGLLLPDRTPLRD